MKIKCPYCSIGFEFPEDMKRHIRNTGHKTIAATRYVDMIFKIHEKIESFENDGRLLTMQPLELIIQELKSLLEDEK